MTNPLQKVLESLSRLDEKCWKDLVISMEKLTRLYREYRDRKSYGKLYGIVSACKDTWSRESVRNMPMTLAST